MEIVTLSFQETKLCIMNVLYQRSDYMSQGLPLREDVPVSETWDLVDLFKDDQQYYESIDALVQQANQFHHTYATTLNSIEQINTALAELENILIALDRLSNYAELRLSVDTSNIEAQVLSAKLSTTYGKIVSQLSFVRVRNT